MQQKAYWSRYVPDGRYKYVHHVRRVIQVSRVFKRINKKGVCNMTWFINLFLYVKFLFITNVHHEKQQNITYYKETKMVKV